MIELNLLPDVKQELVKASRVQRIIIVASLLASAAAIALVVTLFSLSQIQKKHINDLNQDIAKTTAQIQKDSQLKKILTVQNQLNSLTALHASKPAASRLFNYLIQTTPSDVSITNFTVDFNTHKITITGTAPTLSSVNKYVDTLKFTQYKIEKSKTSTKAFSGVVLSSYTVSGQGGITYSVSFQYDPVIFDINKTILLSVPNQTSTRSSTEQPTQVFKDAPKQEGN
ncbi:MAG: PilN domain-containing protein [bacterium]